MRAKLLTLLPIKKESGTIEDPVTGTASGVMGAYYMSYIELSD